MEAKSINNSLKVILISIAVGIWAIVLQNAGIIPSNQNVIVNGGYVNAGIDGKVNVSVDNTVDVNLEQINGNSNAFYDFGGNKNYVRIPVMTDN